MLAKRVAETGASSLTWLFTTARGWASGPGFAVGRCREEQTQAA